MRAELIAIGSELLLGDSVDTNSAWISTRLAEIGVDVYRHTTVGDNVARLAAALQEAVARADAVIVTGGLGPTQDDITRAAVAAAAGVTLRRDPDLVEAVRQRWTRGGRTMPLSNLVQADLPEGARALAPVGTAPGLALDLPGGATIYCVPGVPSEMRVMVTRDIIEALSTRGGLAATVSRLVRTAGISESAVAEAVGAIVDRLAVAGNPTVAFLATRAETRVRVTGKAADRVAALALVDPVVEEIVAALGAGVVGMDDEGTEHAVARLLGARGWTLAVAESMTGGGIGARLVTVAGASDWFRGGAIVYATDTKASLAGADPEVVAAHGPVSEATAASLAQGVRQRLGADVGLALVGVAGPTTQGSVEVGTVCMGRAIPGAETQTRTFALPGRARADVLDYSVSFALDFLRRGLAGVE